MKKRFASEMSRVARLKDEDIDYSDIPPLDETKIRKGGLRRGLAPVERKTRINIMLSGRVIAWFKAKAKGRGYQTLINTALEETIDRETMEELIRRIIREELGKKHRRAA